MNGVVDVGVWAEAVERQVFHLLVARVELEGEILVGMIIAKMRTARREFPFGEPELTNGHDAGEFEAVLPIVAIEIASVIAATADAAAGNDALRDEMKWPRAESTGGAGKKSVLAKVGSHVVAVRFPLSPIVGINDGWVLRPNGRSGGRTAGGGLREERRDSIRREDGGKEKPKKKFLSAGTVVHR